jgi:glycosyltransferase involved in cell wall biosynthesis
MPGAEAVSDRPAVSVIVVSYQAAATLERCLESLDAQLDASAEVIVADGSPEDPRLHFRQQFPHVRFLRCRGLTIPELRREALRLARGEIVALTEARLVPAKNWLALLREAHRTHPEAPAIGGAIAHAGASAYDTAVFFCEYGWHLPPIPDGPAPELSGANLSYKRWALDVCQDLVDAAAWEPFLHRRLEQHGHELLRAGQAQVAYHNSLTLGQFLRQRFHYGRWFAAERARSMPWARRLAHTAFTPLLPLLLTFRLARLAAARGHLGEFLRALPWIVVFEAVWSLGEGCGYLFGKGGSGRQVF